MELIMVDKSVFKIDRIGGADLGRCYSSQSFLISSSNKLSKKTIMELFRMNIFGCGQECRIVSTCDGTEKKNTVSKYFEYECTVYCDSGD